MVWIGVDAHRRGLAAVAVDETGRERDARQVPNTAQAWAELLGWAETLAEVRAWGIEGSGQAGAGLAQQLVVQGEPVAEVTPNLTAAQRRRSRRPAKSDHDDARAIARVLRQEGDALPQVQPEDLTSQLAGLSRERDQLRAELGRVEPTYQTQLPPLTTATGLQAVLDWSADHLTGSRRTALQAAQRRARRMQTLATDLATVSAELRRLSQPVCQPLTAVHGVAELSAGMLAGYLGPGVRFSSDAQLASYAGVAPLEASSAGGTRHRLNRTGQRKLNQLLHRITLTQARGYAPAKQYLARRQAEGKTWREAIRALKRYVARAIFQAWTECLINLGHAT